MTSSIACFRASNAAWGRMRPWAARTESEAPVVTWDAYDYPTQVEGHVV